MTNEGLFFTLNQIWLILTKWSNLNNGDIFLSVFDQISQIFLLLTDFNCGHHDDEIHAVVINLVGYYLMRPDFFIFSQIWCSYNAQIGPSLTKLIISCINNRSMENFEKIATHPDTTNETIRLLSNLWHDVASRPLHKSVKIAPPVIE